MIRKPNGPDAKRLAAGVVAVALASVGAVALASPANAASALNSLTISPTTSTTGLSATGAGNGNCAKFVVSGTDVDGSADAGSVVTVQLSPSDTTVGFCDAATGTTYTAATTQTVTTTTAGAVVYVGSTKQEAVTVQAFNGAPNTAGTLSSNKATLNVVSNVNDAVKTLTATPTNSSVSAGQPAAFTLTALDANGNPVKGVIISRNNANEATCGPTDSTGKATCTVPGSETATSSSQTFYVNYSAGTGALDTGEPSVTTTITVVQQKAINSLTLTCVDQTVPATANSNNSTGPCAVPKSGTATVKATARDAAGNPVQGAVVNFTSTGGNFSSPQATTDANGVATTTLTATQPNGANTESDTVTATSAALTSAGVTINFTAPAATSLAIQPGNESAALNGSVTENAQIVDQFGKPFTTNNNSTTVTYLVTAGRNAATKGTVNTGSNGSAIVTYADKGTNPTATTDTLQISNSNNYPEITNNVAVTNGTYTITYVASTTVSSVALNFVAAQSDTPACTTNTSDPKSSTTNSGSANTAAEEVCALVKNSSNQALGGQTVTFTVNSGSVGNTNVVANSASTTYTAVTNAQGVAVAYVTSQTAGAQTITAATGGVTSNTLTDTYSSSNPVYTLTSTPTTATVAAGSSQTFTVKATDQAGQPVANEEIIVQQSGPGAIGNSLIFTSSAGTASVQLSTSATDSGAGSVTFEDNFGTFNGSCQSADGGHCTATSTYTVTSATTGTSTVKNVTVSVNGGATIGSTVTATANVTNAAGAAVAGETVNFAVTGAEATSGSAVTNSSGAATFTFTATAAGTFTVTATSSTNPAASGSASGTTGGTTPPATREATTIKTIFSPRKGTIQITATVFPVKAGQTLHFVAVVNGKPVYETMGTTGPAGNATTRINHLVSGRVYTFSARVVHPAPVGTYAANRSFRVK